MSSATAAKYEQPQGAQPPAYEQQGASVTAGPGQPSSSGHPMQYMHTTGQPVVYGQPTGSGNPTAQIQTTALGPSVVYGQPNAAGQINYGPQMGYPQNTVLVQYPGRFVVQPTKRPPDYMTLSIISIFFCFPMAICSVMFSCNSKTSSDTGDFARALSEGRTSRNISIAAIVIGIIIITICVGVPVGIISSVQYTYGRYYK